MEEEAQKKCPYCNDGDAFQHRRGLVEHMRKKHKEEPNLEDRIREVPTAPFRKECPYCHKAQGNLSRHKVKCKSRPRARNGEDSGDEGEMDESNEQFLRKFEQNWLRRPASTLSQQGSTVKEYVRYVKGFIDMETMWGDDGFRACQWIAPRLEDCRKPRHLEEYQQRGDSESKRRVMGSAYLQLLGYIERHYQDLKDDHFAHLSRAKTMATAQFAKIRRGTFNAARVAAQVEGPPKAKKPRLDIALTKAIISAWQNSKTRAEALKAFGRGETAFEPLAVNSTHGVGAVLGLELLLRGRGVRYDTVRNLTAQEISTGGRRCKDTCFYCGAWVDYLEHKKVCQPRRDRIQAAVPKEQLAKDGGWQGYESDRESTGKKGRVFTCHLHKTASLGPIEHVIKAELALLVQWFGNVHNYDRSKDIGPFKKVSREQVLAMLERIVKLSPSGRELWAQAVLQGGFGIKSPRQLAIQAIHNEGGVDKETKLRAIGVSLKTATERYLQVDHQSRVRETYLMGQPGTCRPQQVSGPARPKDYQYSSSSDSDDEVVTSTAQVEASRIRDEHLRDTNNFQSRSDEPGPSSMDRSSAPPPGPAVVAMELDPGNDSDSDREESVNAREAADRLYAETFQQEQDDQVPGSEVPEVVPDGNLSFWTKFATFLDRFGMPEHEKETRVTHVRGFCQHHSLAIQDLLQWSDLDVAPVDVPPSEDWLADFKNTEDKELAADAYEVLLQFLSTLIPSEEGASDKEDKEAIGDRTRVIEALLSRHRNSNLYQGKGKGKGQGKNSCKD